MSFGKASIIFLSKYMTLNLVHMLLLLSEFSAFVLGLHGLPFVQKKKNSIPPPPSPSIVKKRINNKNQGAPFVWSLL